MSVRRNRFGLRVRIALFATAIVGVALVAGAIVLTSLLRSRLDDTATTAATLRARDVAGLAASGGLPARLALPGEESAVVQVVSADGGVVASTQNIEGEPPITTLSPFANGERVATLTVTALDAADPMRLVAVRADTVGGPVTVYAAESLERSEETVHSIVGVLIIAIPLIVLLVAALSWWAVGRTLRPVRAITATLADITATDLHRRVPEASSGDEIGMLAGTVNDTLSRLDTAVDRQRRFIADASHELRGPLAALRGDLEVSVNHPDRTDWTVVAADTLTDVHRLQLLTEDLLTLARLGATPDGDLAGDVDLVELLDAERRRIAAPPGITIDVADADAAVIVRGSAAQLGRVIRNLLHNAVHHSASHIHIDVITGPDHGRLRIADDGPGIPDGDKARVLEPFVRLDEARTRDRGGTGLGLAIVDEIVRAHHGVMHLSDNTPTGLVVTVDLPSSHAPRPQKRRGPETSTDDGTRSTERR